MRPPIEELKKALEDMREAFFLHISQGTTNTVIALCDYALELEVKLKEMLWEKIKEAQDGR